uniref:DnaJ subfamily C member 2 n=2 Tax=Lygus hesperus TaxID=30085 RepID=A0A0A9XEZ1_LYGHE
MHPDKCMNDIQSEERYQAVLQAHSILRSSKTRRDYLSVIDPPTLTAQHTEWCGDAFYKNFGAIFEQYGRYSVRQPVPQFGDAGARINDVNAFYNFWFEFQSWRTFPLAQPFETSQQRRQAFIAQSAQARSEAHSDQAIRKKEEKVRLQEILSYAYDHDPRIQQFKCEQAAEKKKQRDRKRERKRESRDTKHVDSTLSESMEQDLRQIVTALRVLELPYANDMLFQQKLRENFNYQLSLVWRAFVQSQACDCTMHVDPRTCSTIDTLLRRIVSQLHTTKTVAEKGTPDDTKTTAAVDGEMDGKEDGKKVEKSNQWTEEQVAALIKATQRFPPGTRARWETIADTLATVREGTTTKDVIKQVRKLEVSNLTGASPTSAQSPTQTQAVEDVWTLTQQRELENALRDIDRRDPQRWEKVAARVTDKTSTQVQRRYEYVRQQIRSAKSR